MSRPRTAGVPAGSYERNGNQGQHPTAGSSPHQRPDFICMRAEQAWDI